MGLAFFRHGATAARTLSAIAILVAALFGEVEITAWQIILGALLFYLSEYAMFRFAFHARPSPLPIVLKLQRRLHYDHHVEPNRLELLFLPFWFLAPNLAVTALVVVLARGKSAVGSVILGVMAAILHYECVHYVAHLLCQPCSRIGRWLKTYHLRHRFVSEKQGFGVSNPSLDLVFRTFSAPHGMTKSATVRKLSS